MVRHIAAWALVVVLAALAYLTTGTRSVAELAAGAAVGAAAVASVLAIFESELAAWREKHERLSAAALAIYWAGHWTCDRPVAEDRLWIALRDALELPPGTAPKPSGEWAPTQTRPAAQVRPAVHVHERNKGRGKR